MLKLHGIKDAEFTEIRLQSQVKYLAKLSNADWALWRWVGLRGTGFSVTQILKLGIPDCASKADALNEVEDEAEDLTNRVIETLRNELTQATVGNRSILIKLLKQLGKGDVPLKLSIKMDEISKWNINTTSLIKKYMKRSKSVNTDFQQAYQGAVRQNSIDIKKIAQCERFREAIIWQNRSGLHSSIDALLRMKDDSNKYGSERRRRECLVANYLQRYCVKNDTIGFFGPVGWARLSNNNGYLEASYGESLLLNRRVYFEPWCMDEIGAVLGNDDRVKKWLAPRRVSISRMEGEKLYLPEKVPVKLSAMLAEVYEKCNGERIAKEIAEELIEESGNTQEAETAIYECLHELEVLGAIRWELEAKYGPYPERSLRKQLLRIGEEGLRTSVLSKLDEMEMARERVSNAAGDPEQLDAALKEMEDRFTELTGKAATRAAGRTYAGRTLVYEDCQRNAEITIGYEVWKELERPLSLLLESARWLTYKVAEVYRNAFNEQFNRLRSQRGEAGVDYQEFWSAVRPILFDSRLALVNQLGGEFQRRWSDVLSLAKGEDEVKYKSEEIESRVAEVFGVPHSGWLSARYHNPDVLIAASSVEAINRGDYLWVMGELHIASNALSVPLFTEQHPSPEDLYAAFEADIPESRLVPLPPKYWPTLTPRLMYTFAKSSDYRLELSPEPYEISPDKQVPISELIVECDSENKLIARSRNRDLSFDLLESMSAAMAGEVANQFKVMEELEYSPRVQIDKLVISRRTWRFQAVDLWFAFEREAASRYQEVRRWVGAYELPQYIFVKTVAEVKPFYVDVSSPIYIEVFSKAVRRCVENGAGENWVVVSEMLPEPDECWLQDAEGNSYSSEFRIVAVDLK